ncbi:MAG TPA: ADP-forming succinate--CoA ligase subunit beta [Clostridia bacterium]|nr:ADP-forming succinate--CoA ligase subunit beta [Clostridia bacterium]
MKLYEFMGKELLSQYGIPVPKGQIITFGDSMEDIAKELGPVVIKSQVLGGKRGKAGGIIFADTPDTTQKACTSLLGTKINDLLIEKLLVEEKLKIDQELYLAIMMENSQRNPVVLASSDGGMDIEDVPEENIVKRAIDLSIGLQPYLAKDIARRLGLEKELAKEFIQLLFRLYQMFKEIDAELVEINPLAISGNQLIAADAKITIDDEALFRQKNLPRVEDRTQAEKQAHDIGLSFVQLEGDIAIMANGAGITMATLDTIQFYGGSPANFLDAGGGASEEQMARALEILLMTNPKVILINIFGGITRCDDVARAFLQVKKTYQLDLPVVIRLVGTNEEEGVALLKEHGITVYQTMQEAASRAVALAQRKVDANGHLH